MRNFPGVQFLLIMLLTVAASVVYGEIHDQITAHICVEYFSITHPHVIDSDSPTMLAIVWGFLATWWMGVLLGVPLALAARLGREPRLSAADLVKPMTITMLSLGVVAALAGVLGWWLTHTGAIQVPREVGSDVPPEHHTRWMGVWWTHSASYDAGALAALVLMGWVLVTRRRRSLSLRRGTS